MLVTLLRIKRYSQSVQRLSAFPSGLRQGGVGAEVDMYTAVEKRLFLMICTGLGW